MIDIALKHFIYEACINTLFNGIRKNFFLPSKALPDFKVGQTYQYLTSISSTNSVANFYGITITRVMPFNIEFHVDSGSIAMGTTIDGVSYENLFDSDRAVILSWIVDWIV